MKNKSASSNQVTVKADSLSYKSNINICTYSICYE